MPHYPKILVLLFVITGTLLADSPEPKRFEFTEGGEKYYALGVTGGEYQNSFRIFDSKDHFIQVVDAMGVNPSFLRLEDFNFDGYPDLIFPGDGSTAHCSYVEVWLWDPKLKKFVSDDALNDANITDIDPKMKYLYSRYNYHGQSTEDAYTYSSSGKLVHVYHIDIDYTKNTEVKTFYSDDKVTKIVTSAAPPQ